MKCLCRKHACFSAQPWWAFLLAALFLALVIVGCSNIQERSILVGTLEQVVVPLDQDSFSAGDKATSYAYFNCDLRLEKEVTSADYRIVGDGFYFTAFTDVDIDVDAIMSVDDYAPEDEVLYKHFQTSMPNSVGMVCAKVLLSKSDYYKKDSRMQKKYVLDLCEDAASDAYVIANVVFSDGSKREYQYNLSFE